MLLGDGGEQDPEIFAAVVRLYPDQLIHIFIRDESDDAAQGDRYRDAFDGIPSNRWSIFHNGDDLVSFDIFQNDGLQAEVNGSKQ